MAKDIDSRIIWVDLEMTGLNLEIDHIIEMACLVTDSELNVIAEGPNIIIHQPQEVMDAMGDWCKEHHGESGLTEKVLSSKISLQDAEKQMIEFVKKHTPEKVCPLAGNSVHADKKFLDKYMPRFSDLLHYRIIDVSTVKELCKRWYPNCFENAPKKVGKHRAMQDIKESVKELKYYRESIFKAI